MHVSARPDAAGAFTLVELLAVMAIMAVLAGLLLPALGAARTSALKARTRVQYRQWTAACELFRQEYGYYPPAGAGGKLATAVDALQFVRTLSGRNPDGTAVADPADLNGNFKRLAFCSFAGADFHDPDRPEGGTDYSGNELLADALGATEIGVLVDRNGDGFIKPDDDGPAAAVRGPNGGVPLRPDDTALPAAGIRAGVLFYSAGRGAGPGDLILSWE